MDGQRRIFKYTEQLEMAGRGLFIKVYRDIIREKRSHDGTMFMTIKKILKRKIKRCFMRDRL